MQLQRLNEYNQNEACSDPALVITPILCSEALFALRSLLLNNIFIKVAHKVGNREIYHGKCLSLQIMSVTFYY